MIREVKFESQDRRIKQIIAALNENGIKDIEEANAICEAAGLDPYKTCEETQPICFENAKWAYVVGSAIALKKGCKNAAEAAEAIGIGLQAFCIPGSVADDRKVGIGHGNLAAMLLREETKCFAFLAGHESFAAAEGAIKIAAKADKVRKEPLRCILNGLGKDAAQIISRINGFTYVQTEFDYFTGELKVVREIAYSDGPRAKVKCYGADDVREGSGGVADCIEKELPWLEFGDIGPILGQTIRESRLCQGEFTLGSETIRATVIGAGCHSAQLSGSTVFHQNVPFPLKNVPVVSLTDISREAIRRELGKQEDSAILAFPGINSPGYREVAAMAEEIAAGTGGKALICLEQDMAKALGQALALRLGPNAEILCIDRVKVSEGSYLDVGAPVGPALPVVVKTLVLGK